eukprot:23325-Pelagococcus_subviridis.AAC.3
MPIYLRRDAAAAAVPKRFQRRRRLRSRRRRRVLVEYHDLFFFFVVVVVAGGGGGVFSVRDVHRLVRGLLLRRPVDAPRTAPLLLLRRQRRQRRGQTRDVKPAVASVAQQHGVLVVAAGAHLAERLV